MQSNTLLRCPSHRHHDPKQIEQRFGESHLHIQDVEHEQIEQHFVMSRLTVAQGAAAVTVGTFWLRDDSKQIKQHCLKSHLHAQDAEHKYGINAEQHFVKVPFTPSA